KLATAIRPQTKKSTGNNIAAPIALWREKCCPAICITAPRLAAPNTAPTWRAVLYTPDAAPTRCGGRSRIEIVEFGDQHKPLAAPNKIIGTSIQAVRTSKNMKIPKSTMDEINEENPRMDTPPGVFFVDFIHGAFWNLHVLRSSHRLD